MQESALNSPAVWMAAIGVIGTFLTGIIQILLALISRSERNAQHVAVTAQISKTAATVEAVHREVNGQTEKLLQVTGDAREAAGKLAGRAEEKANPS